MLEPMQACLGHLIEGTGFLEQVAGAVDHHELMGGLDLASGPAIQLQQIHIAAADDQQDRRVEVLQPAWCARTDLTASPASVAVTAASTSKPIRPTSWFCASAAALSLIHI